MSYKAVLFDMDGVLIDSEHVMRAACVRALEHYGIAAKAEDFYPFTGMAEAGFIGGVSRLYGQPYETKMQDLAYDYYGQHVQSDAILAEDVQLLLQTLHRKGILLAVCTGAVIRKVRYNIQALGVDESLFSAIVTGSDVVNGKPAPDIYLQGAARLGVDPGDCLVVEDAVNGIHAAHAAGMDAVGIPTTFTPEQLRQQAAPEYILPKTRELLRLFP